MEIAGNKNPRVDSEEARGRGRVVANYGWCVVIVNVSLVWGRARWGWLVEEVFVLRPIIRPNYMVFDGLECIKSFIISELGFLWTVTEPAMIARQLYIRCRDRLVKHYACS